MRWSSGIWLAALALAAPLIGPAEAAEWQTYLSEDFGGSQTMFYTGQAGEAQYGIDEMGRYVIDGLNTGSDSLSSLTDNLYYYYFESQCELVRTIAGEQAFTGVVFHYNKSIPGKLSYYVFYYYGDGYYGAKRVIGEQVEILIPLTPTDTLDMYGVNVLAVDAQGTSFDLYINGRYIDGFTDVRIDGGGFGFYVSKYARAAFDNFSVKVERRPGGREDLSAPVVSNVADEGGSAADNYRDYQFPVIPKDPNRPVYSWEVGVDKTRKAKPAAGEEPESQTAAPAEQEQPPDSAAQAPLSLPPGEELVELGGPAASEPAHPDSATPAAAGAAGNGGEAQEVTTVPAEPVKLTDPRGPRELPQMTVPVIDAAPVDLLGDSGESQPEAAGGELEIPDLDGTLPGRSTAQAEQPQDVEPRLPVVALPADGGADDGELPLYPPDDDAGGPAGYDEPAEQLELPVVDIPVIEDEAIAYEPALDELPVLEEPIQTESESAGELPLYPTEDTGAEELPLNESNNAEVTDALPNAGLDAQESPEADQQAGEGEASGDADGAEDTLPVGESDQEGELRFASVEPKLEEMGVGRATAQDSTALSELDWQAVPIEPVPEDENSEPAADDEAPAVEAVAEMLPQTPPQTEPEPPPAESEARPPLPAPLVDSGDYYSGDQLVVIADDFSTQHWPVSSAEGSAGYRYFGGAYEINNLEAGTMAISFQDSALSDSEFSIDVEFLEGAGQVGYGVASRLNVVNGVVSYYGLFICQNGEFMLLKVHQGNESVLSDWRATSLIRANRPNRIALDARGGMLYAYINGELAAAVADSDIGGGGYALLCGPGVAVRFDNLRIHGFKP